MAYPDMAIVLEPEHQEVKADRKRAFLIAAPLDQVTAQDKLLYPERDALTTCEKEMLRLQHRGSKINAHEPVACAANIESKS
jgi:hypothetical protein